MHTDYEDDDLELSTGTVAAPNDKMLQTMIGYAVYYAEYVIKGRWPEAEPYVMKDPCWAYKYARDVIKDRWQEAESHIMKDPTTWGEYCKHFGIS